MAECVFITCPVYQQTGELDALPLLVSSLQTQEQLEEAHLSATVSPSPLCHTVDTQKVQVTGAENQTWQPLVPTQRAHRADWPFLLTLFS